MMLEILTRTTGVSTNGWGEFDLGISIRFQIADDLGNTAGNVAISHNGYPGSSFSLASGTYAMALNTFYDFRITDDGSNIAVYIGDLTTPLITTVDSSVLGDRIGIYNREGNGGGSSISAGSTTRIDSIQVVPEPSSLASIGLVFLVVAFALRHVKNRKFNANKLI